MKKNVFIFIAMLLPAIAYSQKTVELTVGAGITIVDIESLVEQEDAYHYGKSIGTDAEDWGLLNIGVSAQFVFASMGNVSFGAEAMYQHLYWYSVRIPYANDYIHREYSIDAFKASPFVRIGLNDALSVDLGPSFNFSDGLEMGGFLSANYNISISDIMDIPIKARIDLINEQEVSRPVLSMPVSLHGGIRIKL